MSIVDPVRVGGPVCGLVAILLVSGAVHALTLRSGDGVDIEVDSSSAVAHSGLLRMYLVDIGGEDRVPVPMPAIASRELQLLAGFMNATAVGNVGHADEWVRSQMSWINGDTVGRALAASWYLDMRSFPVAVASLDVDWHRLAASPDVPAAALEFVMNVVARLCRIAQTDHQKAVANQIRDAIVVERVAGSMINNAMWADGLKLLHWVAYADGEPELMAFLLCLPGVNVNVLDIHRQTPLHWAVRADRQDMVALLLSVRGINVNARSMYAESTPLQTAMCAWRNSLLVPQPSLVPVNHDIVALLLNATGIDVDALPTDRTPLHLAAREAQRGMIDPRTIQRLLSMPGINVNAGDSIQRTPLHTYLDWSAPTPSWFIKAVLNTPGVDVNARDFLLRTPLHLAAQHNNFKAVRLLLQAPGINPALRGGDQRTAADLAWGYSAGTSEGHRRRLKILALLGTWPA
ncbi:Ankyrin repeat domain-containing protein [Plasmodiophora brassicae]